MKNYRFCLMGAACAALVAVAAEAKVPWDLYPRPQMVRANWTCLNGEWDYAVTAISNTFVRPTSWQGKITVPFAIESKLSGVGRDLAPDEFLWYRRTIDVSKKPGVRTLLHFDSVDFRAQAFLGHDELDVPHESMNVPWVIDITDKAKEGANELTVLVWDPTETGAFGSTGKQILDPSSCFYHRCSGILGSVWTEEVPEDYVVSYRVTPDIHAGTVTFKVDVSRPGAALVEIEVLKDGHAIDSVKGKGLPGRDIVVKMPEGFACWSPESPALYGFRMRYGTDAIEGYFAMRSLEKRRDENGVWRFFLNGKPYYVMGTLDQGWWPDGLLTPPSEAAMEFDIRTLKEMGFNTLRKHIKVEPLRYYSVCDKLGLIVLQDMPSDVPRERHGMKGIGGREDTVRYGFYRRDLKRVIDHLYNVPAILMWIPYNEGWGQPRALLTHMTLDWVKGYDPSRLVNGPSGWNDSEGGQVLGNPLNNDWRGKRAQTAHRPAGECEAADVVDSHHYPDPILFEANDRRISFVGEFGGITYIVPGKEWTGDTKKQHTYTKENSVAAAEARYGKMMDMLADFVGKGLGGSIYTQTTDVEREMNGLITYDRMTVKFDKAHIRAFHQKVFDAFEKAVRKP